jgi:hypothetical protein
MEIFLRWAIELGIGMEREEPGRIEVVLQMDRGVGGAA